MHWLAWKKLCRHKEDGGLGFRLIEDFNTALLAKQLWRLMDMPDSLFARVFKGRYFRTSSPLDPIKSYSPSYGWQSMVSARSLVQKGLIKRVGSGNSISVWNDPWIPDSRPRSAICKGFIYYPDLRVNQLMNSSTSTWNLPLLHQLFDDKEVALIHGIPTNKFHRPDESGWLFTKTGRYTVKSGYMTLQLFPDVDICPHFGPDIRRLQAYAWKLPCPPKIKHFFWQILTGCLPVGDRLSRRGLRMNPQCVCCGMSVETINHTLFECPPACQVWALSPIPTPVSRFPKGALFTNLAYLFWELPKDDAMLMYPWLLWYIWKARNDKVFSNFDCDPRDIVNLAAAEAVIWVRAQEGDEVVPMRTQFPAAPCEIRERCQIDGSWKETECRTGLGWYYSDSGTGAKLFGARNLRRSLTPLQSEVEALVWAMQCMLGEDKRCVVFETDCLDLVKMVEKPEEWPAFSILLEDIATCRRLFTSVSFKHIPRTKNTKADKLARSARDLPYDVIYVNCIPPAQLSELV